MGSDGMIRTCPICYSDFDASISHSGTIIKNAQFRVFCSRNCKSKKNNTPERQRAYRLKSMYGLTPEKYEEILLRQNNGCAICEEPIDSRSRKLHVDHDHETGIVRGILCTMCNPGLGYFRNNSKLLIKAANYLRNYEMTK